MKEKIQLLLQQSIQELLPDGENLVLPNVEQTRDKSHGDFATNVAMVYAKKINKAPREFASHLVTHIKQTMPDYLKDIEIAGPGFINFKLNNNAQFDIVKTILQQGEKFGQNQQGQGLKIQLEFVSANPTGPLHVGHGRGAAYGATLANILKFSGYQVETEYYVNDAGRQMDILATSVWLRYLQKNQLELPFPSNAYQGDYIYQIVENHHQQWQEIPVPTKQEVLNGLPDDEPAGGDKEIYIDAMIDRCKQLCGSRYDLIHQAAKNDIVTDIKQDLSEFGVNFDRWYSERELMNSGKIVQCIDKLKALNYVQEKDGLQWFLSTQFGDDKDRVLQRNNGQTTYFASDIAYHQDKFERGFERVINIWGADHHGYVARVKAACQALAYNPKNLITLLVQFAVLYRSGQKISMSTRSGSFVTLRELREEVGNDATRFFYVMRKCEQHLDFDLDIAKAKSSENPVYYIQYAYARICSVLRQLETQGKQWDQALALASLDRLQQPEEQEIAKLLMQFPYTIEQAASKYEPHLLANYCRELANKLHVYYNKHHFIVDDESLCAARLALILALKQVMSNSLNLLGISAPESM